MARKSAEAQRLSEINEHIYHVLQNDDQIMENFLKEVAERFRNDKEFTMEFMAGLSPKQLVGIFLMKPVIGRSPDGDIQVEQIQSQEDQKPEEAVDPPQEEKVEEPVPATEPPSVEKIEESKPTEEKPAVSEDVTGIASAQIPPEQVEAETPGGDKDLKSLSGMFTNLESEIRASEEDQKPEEAVDPPQEEKVEEPKSDVIVPEEEKVEEPVPATEPPSVDEEIFGAVELDIPSTEEPGSEGAPPEAPEENQSTAEDQLEKIREEVGEGSSEKVDTSEFNTLEVTPPAEGTKKYSVDDIFADD